MNILDKQKEIIANKNIDIFDKFYNELKDWCLYNNSKFSIKFYQFISKQNQDTIKRIIFKDFNSKYKDTQIYIDIRIDNANNRNISIGDTTPEIEYIFSWVKSDNEEIINNFEYIFDNKDMILSNKHNIKWLNKHQSAIKILFIEEQ